MNSTFSVFSLCKHGFILNRRRVSLLGGGLLLILSLIGAVANPVNAAGVTPWLNIAGPGGGTVYSYVSAGFNCGIDLNRTCHYLEVAGSDWNASNRKWSSNGHSVTGTATGTGTGAKNTALIVALNSTLGYAATYTNIFVSNTGLDDWFLPSRGEVQMLRSSTYSTNFGEVGTSSQQSGSIWITYDSGRNRVIFDTPKTEVKKVLAVRAFSRSDSSLANLTVAGEVLAPSFDPSVTEYSLTTEQESVQFTPVAVGASSVRVGEIMVANGSQSSPIQLNAGLNKVTLTVTAADSSSTSYTVNITREIRGYSVSFDGNGSTDGSVPSDQIKPIGQNLTLSSNSGSLVKTGYTFDGWNTAADGSGISYAEGASYEVDAAETLYAKWTANSLTVTYNSQSGSAVSAGSTTSGGVIASAPVAPTRTGSVFTGWFAATTGGSAISFPYTHGRTADFTLYARWSQASLHGISSVSKIGTITTTANVGNTFAVDTESSSVSLRYPANGLPADTVIDVYLVNDLSRARSLVAPAGGFVVSLVVAWLAADGSVPLMASGKPLSMTIANDTIKAGAKTYAIVGGEVTLLGTASANGSVTISITEDPEIVIVNPVIVSQPSSSQPSSSQPSSSKPASSARRSPVKVVELLPQVQGATSKIAGILNTVAGKLPPKPTVFAPKILSNGQIARIAFTPIQIKAPPANAPVAPEGGKGLSNWRKD